ncbi:MAG: hypothetical protein L0H19_07890 [Salinisphaera sp.]|nr:hypothetical protein [Salinisphaera sp.]
MLDEIREIAAICSMLVALDHTRGDHLKQILPDEQLRRSLATLKPAGLARLAVATRGVLQTGKQHSSIWWRRVITQLSDYDAPTDSQERHAADFGVIASLFQDIATRIMVIRQAPDVLQPGFPDAHTTQALASLTRMEQMCLAGCLARTHKVLPGGKNREWWERQLMLARADAAGPDGIEKTDIAALLCMHCSTE